MCDLIQSSQPVYKLNFFLNAALLPQGWKLRLYGYISNFNGKYKSSKSLQNNLVLILFYKHILLVTLLSSLLKNAELIFSDRQDILVH